MAKLRGPMMSIDARGKFADTIVFGGWKGIPWARVQFTPQNPQTADQTAIRLIFSQGVLSWQDKDAPAKLLWDEATGPKGLVMSGFNYFMSEYISAMRAGTTPPVTPP